MKVVSLVEIIIVIGLVTIAWIGGLAIIQKNHEERGEQSYTCVDSSCYKKELSTNKSFDEKNIVTVEPPIPKPEPVVVKEEVVENHYHFKELNTGLMAFAGLGAFALSIFILYKILGFGRRTFVLSKAKRKSAQIISEFDSIVDDARAYLDYNKKIVEQMTFNRLLVEINQGNPSVSQLMLSNQIMNDKLNFIERKMINDFKN